MRKKVCLLILLLLPAFAVRSQLYPLWSQGNARLEPHKQFTKSVFLPLKYTVIPKLELSAYPVAMFYHPNFAVKKFWVETKERKLLISTRHRLSYPTRFIKATHTPEWLGLYPATDEPPFMLSFRNELLVSKWLKDKSTCKFANYLLTWRIGFEKAFGAQADKVHTLDYPLLLTRTYPYLDEWLLYTGLDLDAHINSYLDFAVDAEFYSAGLTVDYYSIEHKGLLLWHLNENWKVMGGYKLVYGSYPFGRKFSIFPLFDVIMHFKLPEGDEVELFEKKMF